MFPLFGWHPEFAADHSPRFPVPIPVAKPASPGTVHERRRAHEISRPRPLGAVHDPRRTGAGAADEGDDADMSEYQEFTGKSVEEAIRAACEEFGVGLEDLDFEILTPGSRGVLGMGAEPARIVAAPRSALGGAAPKREAAEATPLPTPAAAGGPGLRPRPGPAPRRPRAAAATTGPRRERPRRRAATTAPHRRPNGRAAATGSRPRRSTAGGPQAPP